MVCSTVMPSKERLSLLIEYLLIYDIDLMLRLINEFVLILFRSEQPTRLEKVRDMLANVGVSVLSGACTTLGASVFMLAAKIVFFFQFGLFMFCTIGLSIIYALVVFTTLLALMGPEGKKGSLLPLYAAIKNIFHKRGENEVVCEACKGRGYRPAENINSTRVNNAVDNEIFSSQNCQLREEQVSNTDNTVEQPHSVKDQKKITPYILYASPV